MNGFRPKLWAGIGAAAFAAACQPASNSAESAAPEAHSMAAMSATPAGVGESGEGGGDLIAAMNADDAAAFRWTLMKGHLATAMKLVEEGAGKEGAMHFLHPINEIYDPAKADYAAKNLSLDTAKFTVAAEQAALGKASKDIRPQWEALNKQVDKLAPKQYSKPVVLKALFTQMASEYRRGVEGPTVTNAPEYQDAFGFSIVAAEILAQAARENAGGDAARSAELQREGEALVNMFPSAVAPAKPASAGEVQAQISRIQLAYPGME